MQPFAVLLLMPVLIGVAAHLLFRDVRHAAGAATLASTLVVYGALYGLDPGGGWNWLAGLMVLPLPVAIALATVVLCYGRAHGRRRHRGSHG